MNFRPSLAALAFAAVSFFPMAAEAQSPPPAPPGWWSATDVQGGQTAVTRGLLKSVARHAAAHLDATLPGGAGGALHSLVDGYQPGVEDGLEVTFGTMRAVALPFYQRLWQEGWTGETPWDLDAPENANGTPLTFPELETAFGFDLTGFAAPAPAPVSKPGKSLPGAASAAAAGPQANLINPATLVAGGN
ncbi:MAG: hypothetical protein WDN28_24530 [Chthoniobacter sp.]